MEKLNGGAQRSSTAEELTGRSQLWGSAERLDDRGIRNELSFVLLVGFQLVSFAWTSFRVFLFVGLQLV